jgi:glycosyltransferase involved in cell wall biosynthesis
MGLVARHPLRRLLQGLLERASAVVCPGREIGREVLAVARRARVLWIPNGVDTAVFCPAEAPVEEPRVVSVLRLGPSKGVERLLRTWAIVERERPHAVLEVVGDGPERLAARELADALGLRNTRLLGAREDVPELLRAAQVFVLASDAEGMSNALLEAMATGLACVVTDVPGNREALGPCGRVVAKDEAALARAIVELLEPGPARELGLAARSRALELFGVERMVERYESLYRARDLTSDLQANTMIS